MSILAARHQWKKMYRPTGTRYANSPTHVTPELAVADAMVAFETEFGRKPRQEYTVIEILGVTGGWAATVLEIKEPA